MNKAQIVVLGVALAAGGGAFLMMSRSSQPPAVVPVVQAPALDEVLVAARDLPYGMALNDQDTAWILWPLAAVPQGATRKSETPNAKEEIKDSLVHVPIASGDLLRRDRLIKGQSAGLMSTMLPSGRRAVAIDVSLNTTAGGFILPNDHVDVIRTYRDQEQTKDRGVEVFGSEVLLSNVRVLAMGQTVETKSGDPVITGATATLELDAGQAELVVLAQRTGQLALALRALTDARPTDANGEFPPETGGNMTIVRFGAPVTLRSH
ncbi:MAG: Flp pilus assembly protein CpaB [Methylocystis sp.]|nr:Flp pilus assembly protein CpaB [Methylocystis sp.]